MSRALVTGIMGQDGYYLALELNSRGHEVYGLVRGQNNPKLPRLRQELPFVNPVEGDLLDRHSLCQAMEQARPDYVYNLGAITYIPLSWQQPELVYNINFLGVQRLLEECVDHGVKGFGQASTSEMFGSKVNTTGGLYEDSPMNPRSPYAIAKLAAHHLCLAYSEAGKIAATSVIMFNHESPRRGENFVTRKITIGMARIKAGLQENLELGNLNAARDWGYSPEYMDAMRRAVELGVSSSYVVATGHVATVGEFANHVAELAGVDPRLVVSKSQNKRVNDLEWLCGNSARIRRELGWEAHTTWPELARIMYQADREALKA